MSRRFRTTFTFALACALTFLWCSESDARCWLRRRDGHRRRSNCASANTGYTASLLAGGCVCPYMRYASFPDYEQWTARECPSGTLFSRDYPTGTYMGMCPNPPFFPNCNSPCQPTGYYLSEASHQSQKRNEADMPDLDHPVPYLGETAEEITVSGENYWFKNSDGEKYFVRILTYDLPRGWYQSNVVFPPLRPLSAKKKLSHGYQIFEPAMSTEITQIKEYGSNVYELKTGGGPWVRVITTGMSEP